MLRKVKLFIVAVIMAVSLTYAVKAEAEEPCWGGTHQLYRVECSFSDNGFCDDQCLGPSYQEFGENGAALGFEDLELFGYNVRYRVDARMGMSTVEIRSNDHHRNRQVMMIKFFFNCGGASCLENLGGNIISRNGKIPNTSCTMTKGICNDYNDFPPDDENGMGMGTLSQESNPPIALPALIKQALVDRN